VDDLLLLLNHHWARDTSTFPTERHRVQFALILLLLFGTGCRPAKLVNTKKKRKDDIGFDDDNFEGVNDNDILAAMSGVEEDIRHFDAICYEDVRLLVVRSSGSEERDVLAMEVTMAHHKGHKRRPKP
jgi:hypothetical protein